MWKQIHEQKRKQKFQKYDRGVVFFETSEFYWYQKQNDILDYIEEKSFENKNILVLSDDTGLCSIILNKKGANVFWKEGHDLNQLRNENMKLNSVKEKMYHFEEKLDYIFEIGDKFVPAEELKGDTKMIIALKGVENVPGYSAKQLTCYRSGKNTLFEIQKNKVSWLQ